ncbi:protein disulfide isomerase I [Yersinia frederiksenii]|uniref:Thiol:disulfide interchange protein n=2 Tax=Yersinia frederiksenii TaxID=29484 RepID=A0A380Q039_YERFR|nr:thiol:disulfide interchange protein DsbA/DsbL [Yersinia frederiksenii]ATM96502.1 thiol:disulfide interchange protein [Yersinia frederiksenii]EEQ13720.1 Thiol:disulfide interchange protein dsbA-like protein [Yersinia frederiksenii ATCC 33641]KGA48158.1 DSBA-like thioredoxin domain protein [Yersinia frederiksenii ATCC 33641]SUP79190.1 protein disulfide isomerase I [Yersinia frederiksenii]
MLNTLVKKITKGLVVICAILSFSVAAFTEGTDYIVLEKVIPDAQGTLIKVFSYDCPFCYRYDKGVTPVVMQQVNDFVKFDPFHLETKGKYGVVASELFAVLINKDQESGVSLLDDKSLFKKAKFAFYNAYHDKKERWDGGADEFLKTGLDAVAMSKEDFEQALTDPKVQAMLKRWKEYAYDVAKIQGVPAFVVNGKYLILTKSIRSTESMADLIKQLASQ